MKKILNNKIISIIFATLEWLVFFVLLVLIVLTGFQKFSNQGNFFGYRIYTVASGSMIPIYNIGDTLLIEEMDASKLKVGDAVTYMGDGGGVDGMIITHQVIDVQKDENGRYLFQTKGIANNIEDPVVHEDQLYGVIFYNNEVLAFLCKILTNRYGLYCFVVAIILYSFIGFHKFFFLSFLGRITTNMTSMLVFITVPIAFLIALEIIKLVYKDDIEEIKSSMKSNDEPNISDEPDDESKVVNEEINHIEDGKEEKTEEQSKE